MAFKSPLFSSCVLKANPYLGRMGLLMPSMPTVPSQRGERLEEEGGEIMKPAQSSLLRDMPSSEATAITCDGGQLSVAT